MKILQATLHQGDLSFVGHGRQCVANSIMAIMKSKVHDVDNWTKVDLDSILRDGDRIYHLITSKTKQNSEYILLDDIPSMLESNLIQKSKPKAGLVNQPDTEGPFHHLEGAFSSLLTEMPDTDGMLLTMGNSTPSYTGAVIRRKENNTLYYFDSHARGDTGMSASDGKATFSSHNSLPSLCLFIKHLSSSLFRDVSKVPFEIVAVKIEKISDYLETLDNNCSFNESENELNDFNPVNINEKGIQEAPINNSFSIGADSDSDSDFSGFNPVADNELEERLSKLSKMYSDTDETVSNSVSDFSGFESVDGNEVEKRLLKKTNSDKEKTFSDTDQSQTDLDDSNNINLIAETVGDINDSFTLLRAIDTDIIENYEGTSEDLSDGSYKDPSYKQPKQNRNESSTDEDFPLHFFNRRKFFHKSKCRDNEAENKSKQNTVGENNGQNLSKNTLDKEIQYNIQADAYKESEKNGAKQSSHTESAAHETQNSDYTESCEGNRDETQNKDSVPVQNNMPINNTCLNQETPNIQIGSQEDAQNQQKRGRKRTRNEDVWKRNVTKRRRNEGKSYVARSGKLMKARVMRKACGNGCKFSCNNKMNEETREKVFHHFWATGDISLQRQFLIKFAEKRMKSSGTDNENNRKYSVTYTLPNLMLGETHRVCKTFFLNTLGISHQMVSTAHLKQEHLPGVVNIDRRGKMPGSRSNLISEEQLTQVREHIKSFTTIESHYCRKDSSRNYLDPKLSLKKMYELYCEKCSCDGSKPVLLHKYREIFNKEFNLGFYQPKKDQCDFCARYKNATDSERENLAKDYENHIKNKELARENKSKDKERSKTEKDLAVACFDLQQVLLTPKGFESSLYYKRRLNTYNFSLYNYETADGFCYVWNESISGRGANEMASCVYDFIEKFSKKGKKSFIFYSDNASSQNKNKYYISMLWYALNKFGLKSVEHKYLIAGHTQNENDSVHSTIENVSRNKEVYSTSQWAATIRTARSGNGYQLSQRNVYS